MSEIEFHVEDGWTAVYLDGELQRVGDSYLADEWLQARFGVTVVHDGAFMRGQSRRDGVAKTLDEVEAYRAERDAKRARRDELQAEIDRLPLQPGEARRLVEVLDALPALVVRRRAGRGYRAAAHEVATVTGQRLAWTVLRRCEAGGPLSGRSLRTLLLWVGGEGE